MEADVLNALQNRVAYFSGGKDREGRLLIVVPVPSELQPWTKRNLELALKYLISVVKSPKKYSGNSTVTTQSTTVVPSSSSSTSQEPGLSIIVDTQRSSVRMARATVRYVESIIGGDDEASSLIFVVRPDAFWDTQLVENCTKSNKKGETITLPKSRLDKHFDAAHLPEELGGTSQHNHDKWLQQRVRIEEFAQSYDRVLNDLENLHVILLEHKSTRADESAQALTHCTAINDDVQRTIRCTIENGHCLIAELCPTTATNAKTDGQPPPASTANYPDLLISRTCLELMVQHLSVKQNQIVLDWYDFHRNIESVRELAQLEDGVSRVTNWIMGTAERLLNAQYKIGCDVQTCETLRLEHELLEMQCRETYGLYAELLHKIKMYPIQPDTFAHKDLMSRKEFMDFVCRSFAARLERRRNVLIATARFYRLVSEYFDRTSEVFETLVMGNKVTDFDSASTKLKTLNESEQDLDKIIKELEKEGEKLTDVLSMPIKDALGRDCGVDYNDDIITIRDILDATIARRNIFIDSVELQKLTLEQITHIHAYEQDASVARQWIDDLFAVMRKTHLHVGCNVYEIQMQKDELQTFQETAKGTFNYGCQLLDAALALRQSCKLPADANRERLAALSQSWTRLLTVSQEQMTRLRVSSVFHRSIEEHCVRLQELKATVAAGCYETDCVDDRRACVRMYLISRERLLVEVGRMVRLGRLLKTRLKEPFNCEPAAAAATSAATTATSTSTIGMADSDSVPNEVQHLSNATTSDVTGLTTLVPSAFATSSNGIACEAISAKLTEVSKIAESLDLILRDLQEALDEEQTSLDSADGQKHVRGTAGNGSDDWNSSFKSSTTNTTEDELFVTASEGTLQSRSSYRTASEGDPISPWNAFDAESSDIDPERPTMQLLNGVVVSSTSASFDDSDRSLVSEQRSPPVANQDLTNTQNDTSPEMFNERVREHNVGADLIAAKVSSNASSSLSQELLTWSTYCNVAITKHTLKGCL